MGGRREAERRLDQARPHSVVSIGRRSGAHPAVHRASPHHHGCHVRQAERPAVVALAEPGEHAVAAHPEEQVAVQEPRPAAEHRLFRQAHVPRQLFADQVLRPGSRVMGQPVPTSIFGAVHNLLHG